MVFSDTTGKAGMIQTFEFWTRMPDGTVTGTLLKQITARINAGFDSIIPLLLSYSDYIRWDDTNHTDRPIGTINLVSGQADYTLGEDDNTLDILNVTNVRILQSATDTEYVDLERMTIDDERTTDAMSPNPSNTGVPSHWLEVGNTIYLYPEPNFSATDGIKLFFEREQQYFDATGADDRELGIPKPFHELPVLYAALDWNMVNRSEDAGLINRLQARILRKEQELKRLIDLKNPTKCKITMKKIEYI